MSLLIYILIVFGLCVLFAIFQEFGVLVAILILAYYLAGCNKQERPPEKPQQEIKWASIQ